MLDSWGNAKVKPILHVIARALTSWHIRPNQVTVLAFIVGLCAVTAIAMQHYLVGLGLILANRVLDGLDGALARIQGITDLGGFLDITFDFIFYALVVVGFAIANPEQNALSAAILIASFMSTGSCFLAFAVMAAKQKMTNTAYQHKSLYYLGGIIEGAETTLFFIAMSIMPQFFVEIAALFTTLCFLTTASRIAIGIQAFQDKQ